MASLEGWMLAGFAIGFLARAVVKARRMRREARERSERVQRLEIFLRIAYSADLDVEQGDVYLIQGRPTFSHQALAKIARAQRAQGPPDDPKVN